MRRLKRLPAPTTILRSGLSTFRFYHADSLKLLEQLPPDNIDVIITSPPYNLGIRYRSYRDTLSETSYLRWTDDWIAASARVLATYGSLFLNVGTKPTLPWTAIDVALKARNHLVLQNTIHWIKSIVVDRALAGSRAELTRDLAVGHYKPINSERFLNDCHEFVFHLTPKGHTRLDRRAIGVPYQDTSNIDRWRNAAEGLRCRGNTWFIPYTTIQNRDRDRPHPAIFPPLLPEYCLKLHGVDRARIVMDPFMGLGSTAIACVKLGVDFLGIEMDRNYLDEAIERTRRAIKQERSTTQTKNGRKRPRKKKCLA